MKTTGTAVMIAVAVLCGIVRVYIGGAAPVGLPAPLWVTIYKDLAHVFVGLLIGWGWYDSGYESRRQPGWCYWLRGGEDRIWKWLVMGLCVLEVAVATISRMG